MLECISHEFFKLGSTALGEALLLHGAVLVLPTPRTDDDAVCLL